ncbi:P-loop containing nucleoside triphosphate hydrolase protein [Polychytrium aggregatum]|uniref:P-loop containing nucleoside triphosphate hydrolase protein n=1 Tax=Polychytrium aggregatum TaxID=110093 RepID=UPI0022FE2263|nr:P-loop containing nucleoside triphosphate hydrolase protein [Polychytrium aggregatum]KAI9209028.1 P-loop containing nucleoside triphosphate hydrolase protein [Polychytrium aggregatum]
MARSADTRKRVREEDPKDEHNVSVCCAVSKSGDENASAQDTPVRRKSSRIAGRAVVAETSPKSRQRRLSPVCEVPRSPHRKPLGSANGRLNSKAQGSPSRSPPADDEPRTPKSVRKPSDISPKPCPATPRTPTQIYLAGKSIFRRCATPSRLIGREHERSALSQFWSDHVLAGVAGSLYISGYPGTGKTALVEEIMREMHPQYAKLPHKVEVIKLNCMTIKDPKQIYSKLVFQMEKEACPYKGALDRLEALFISKKTSSKPKAKSKPTLFLVILDEIDHLLTGDQEVLYKLFEWPTLKSSSLVLLGIANALDMTNRFLPRLKAKNCEPELLNFNPYDHPEITKIIRARLESLVDLDELGDDSPAPREYVPGGHSTALKPFPAIPGSAPTALSAPSVTFPLMHTNAIEVLARKVAGTGDLRKALDVCRQAIEIVENETRAKAADQPEKPDSALALDMEAPVESLDALPKVTVAHVLKAAINAFGSPIVAKIKALNSQQKVVLCACMMLESERKAESTVGTINDRYIELCRNSNSLFTPVTASEFRDLLSNLESNGLIACSASKATDRNRKVNINVSIDEVCSGIADISILAALMDDFVEKNKST